MFNPNPVLRLSPCCWWSTAPIPQFAPSPVRGQPGCCSPPTCACRFPISINTTHRVPQLQLCLLPPLGLLQRLSSPLFVAPFVPRVGLDNFLLLLIPSFKTIKIRPTWLRQVPRSSVCRTGECTPPRWRCLPDLCPSFLLGVE